jgi:hypothetical protein
MSTIVDRSAALVASPRPRVSLDLVLDARLLADDAQPRLENRPVMTAAAAAWRRPAGSTMRGFGFAAEQETTTGRTVIAGAAYATTKQHVTTRSGPPTSRPPA